MILVEIGESSVIKHTKNMVLVFLLVLQQRNNQNFIMNSKGQKVQHSVILVSISIKICYYKQKQWGGMLIEYVICFQNEINFPIISYM